MQVYITQISKHLESNKNVVMFMMAINAILDVNISPIFQVEEQIFYEYYYYCKSKLNSKDLF